MSRATRRHPQKGKARNQRQARPAAMNLGTSSVKRPPRDPAQGRTGLGRMRPRWAEDIVSELRKVTWPSREDTQYLTIVVLIVASAFGVFLGGVDMFFNWFIENTLLR